MVFYNSVRTTADEIIKRTERQIRLGIPLGLGKPNQLVNELFKRACDDITISLEIYTALSLTKPVGKSGLEQRFLQPFVDRIYSDYVELDYIRAAQRNELPRNISVYEFFVKPGAELKHPYAQQHYMSSNYTHAARDLNNRGCNVIAQMLAVDESNGKKRYSLSCNPEVTLDLLPMLEQRRAAGETIIVIGQVNRQLPFIENHAVIDDEAIDILLDDKRCQTALFSTPNMPVSIAEHCIGLHASTLIRDGGTLQIGIGAIGDAVAAATLMREQNNASYQRLVKAIGSTQFQDCIDKDGGLEPFAQGLYGCSEMFTYGLLRLIEEKVIRRTVTDSQGREILFHGGFFLGPLAFYQGLHELPQELREKIDLLNISFVNHLHNSSGGDESLKREQRQYARFINTAFSMTLMGAAISDQLEDGRILSGVGGQYNFVAQAHELEHARSILMLRATRTHNGNTESTIVWNYGHTTIPRHLRDIVITEYGIADLRSKSDAEVIKAMLNITDSRFQQELMEQAKAAGKLEEDYSIPEAFQDNFPGRLHSIYQQFSAQGYLAEFPLGCDFSHEEQTLIKALGWLKANARPGRLLNLAKNLSVSDSDEERFALHLRRMGLDKTDGLKEELYKRLLLAALSANS